MQRAPVRPWYFPRKPMPLWKLTLAYDGASFHGWQIQPRQPTIQGALAAAIRHVTGETVLPQGSGRTDAGVHALAQVASFALNAPIPPHNLLRALNRALPPAIRVLSAQHAPLLNPPFHARHSAQRKTYEYRIFPRVPRQIPSPVPHLRDGLIVAKVGIGEADPSTTPQPSINDQATTSPFPAPSTMSAAKHIPDLICPPFLAPYAWDCPWPIDLSAAQHAAQDILGEHDFTSFAAADPDQSTRNGAEPRTALSTAIRTIYRSCWHLESGLILYRVTGSGFLHHMVRNLVGTFVEIAAGRTAADAIPTILAARDRAAAGPTAPACGLFLLSVEYPAEYPA